MCGRIRPSVGLLGYNVSSVCLSVWLLDVYLWGDCRGVITYSQPWRSYTGSCLSCTESNSKLAPMMFHQIHHCHQHRRNWWHEYWVGTGLRHIMPLSQLTYTIKFHKWNHNYSHTPLPRPVICYSKWKISNRSLHGPNYLTDSVQACNIDPARTRLRSASSTDYSVPRTRTKCLSGPPSCMEQFTCSSSWSRELVFVQAQAQNSSVHFIIIGLLETDSLLSMQARPISQTFVIHSPFPGPVHDE